MGKKGTTKKAIKKTAKKSAKSTKKVAKTATKSAKKSVTKVANKSTAKPKPAAKVKKATKKVSTSKPKTAKSAPVWQITVTGDKIFYTLDQQELRSILDLVRTLDNMEDYVFHHHVSFHNNDFANWIEDIYDLEELADQLRVVHDKHETQLALLRYIVNKL